MYPFPTLPKRLSSFIFAQLCDELPPPTDTTADTRDNRDAAAMAAVAALGPIDLTEAMLAVRVVATDAHARDSLRLAGLNQGDLRAILRCRAQAASMMRQSQQAMRALERLQAMRPLTEPEVEIAAPGAGLDAAEPRPAEPKRPARAAKAAAAPPPIDPRDEPWDPPPNNLPAFAQAWALPPRGRRMILQPPYQGPTR